ncbi:gag-pol polyprotein [Cucumis melo var. makuwa]|uniref:Gag-pol polyprotein n=1 Tax=Cucumis melo var. makuwa TaxID=1194695 RepID=A0A5A7UN01_CUCMM|nr:gag-pol polyprotein [Cucumis melo var. makuwa]
MFISQEKYAKNIVKKFGLDKLQHKRTPIATHVKITKDFKVESVDNKLYRSMVGSLLYLTASRPDITYSIGVCARFQSDLRVSHLAAVKRIIKYVHGTSEFGILHSFDTNSTLVGYCDEYNYVSLSTTEAEYIAAGSGYTQLIWMKKMLYKYGIQQHTMTLYSDNMSAIDLSKNFVQHS